MSDGRKGWFSAALLLTALSALAWFAPIRDDAQSSGIGAVAAAFDAAILPLIGAVGRTTVAGLFAAAALYVTWRGFGFALPRLPRRDPGQSLLRRNRPEPENEDDPPVPLQRRRGLARLSVTDETGPLWQPAPPDDVEAEFAPAPVGVELGASDEATAETDPQPNNPLMTERAHAEYLAACHGPDEDPSRDAMLLSHRKLLGPEAQLSDALYETSLALVREQQRRSTPHGLRVDPVVLARKRRERTRDWRGDRSWFGGLPRLGGAEWPTGPDTAPLPFAAQIDLAEIAAVCPASPLPHEGSLAFFLNAGAVVYVSPGEHEPTPAPAGLPPAFDEGSYPLPERPSRVSMQLFPFWPVEPVALPLSAELHAAFGDEERHEEIYEAQHEQLAERIPTRQHAFSVYSAREAGIASADHLWWHAALHVEEQLRDALDGVERAVALRETWIEQARDYRAKLAAAEQPDEQKIAASKADEKRHQAQIPGIRQQGVELETFLANYAGFTAGRGPWEEMTDEEIDLLAEVLKESRARFPDLCRSAMPLGLDDLRNLCIRRMVAGGPEALTALPDDMLAFVNEGYRLTTQSPHQMFGLAGVKQYNLYDHLSDLLLLQLSYDDMNEWRFGDMGLWHFWISPEDAAARRWDNATLTFECA